MTEWWNAFCCFVGGGDGGGGIDGARVGLINELKKICVNSSNSFLFKKLTRTDMTLNPSSLPQKDLVQVVNLYKCKWLLQLGLLNDQHFLKIL